VISILSQDRSAYRSKILQTVLSPLVSTRSRMEAKMVCTA